MKQTLLTLALMGFAAATSKLSAGDCDCNSEVYCDCSCRDDSGLLDDFDRFAGNIHSGIQRSLSRATSSVSSLSRWRLTRIKGSSCDENPGCGCEVYSQEAFSPEPHGAVYEPYSASPNYHSQAPTPSKIQLQPVAPPQHFPPVDSVPPSLSVPPPQSLPDSQVDPFKDETTPSGKHVRGRTIQYRVAPTPYAPRLAPVPSSGSLPSRTAPSAGSSRYSAQASVTRDARKSYENQPAQSRYSVRTATGESPSMNELFRDAYRVGLSDTAEHPKQQSTASGLRQVPVSQTQNRSVQPEIATEDPYERDFPSPPPEFDNPLRR